MNFYENFMVKWKSNIWWLFSEFMDNNFILYITELVFLRPPLCQSFCSSDCLSGNVNLSKRCCLQPQAYDRLQHREYANCGIDNCIFIVWLYYIGSPDTLAMWGEFISRNARHVSEVPTSSWLLQTEWGPNSSGWINASMLKATSPNSIAFFPYFSLNFPCVPHRSHSKGGEKKPEVLHFTRNIPLHSLELRTYNASQSGTPQTPQHTHTE